MATAKKRPPPNFRKVERQYARQLEKIARHVGDIIGGYPPGDPAAAPAIERALRGYSDIIRGWAKVAAQKMIAAVDKQDENEWRERSREMSVAMREELRHANTGETLRTLLDEQVTLITSIPLEAAQRVHRLTLAGLEDSTRAKEVAADILNSNNVAAARARLIARTEVARTASQLTQARATHVGSEGYIWRTSGDTDVRDSHAKMNGKFVRWDSPPTLTDGTVTHAGQIYNCRCYPEAVIPD
jgi:SPP1 gp7 family putative phage head morphogenesis protein